MYILDAVRNFKTLKCSLTLNVMCCFAAGLALLVASCGRFNPPKKSSDDLRYEDVSFTVQNAEVGTRESLSLNAASQFSGEIKGCASGYTLSVTESSQSVKVQKDDINCFFRLAGLTSNGEVFDLSSVEDGNFAVGSRFSVVGRSGTLAEFQVLKQLGSPIVGLQEILIVFGSSGRGERQVAAAGVAAGIALDGAEDVPLESLDFSVSVSSQAATFGFGVFQFDLGCLAEGGTVDAGGVLRCGAVQLADLTMGLADDTSRGLEIGIETCRAIAATAGATGTPFGNGSERFPMGGIQSAALIGPGRLYDVTHANLIFAVSAPGQAGGCRYFRISVQAP